MAQQLVLNIKGLRTNVNEINTPAGYLKTAKNISIDSQNIASSRRGLKKFATATAASVGQAIKNLFTFDGGLISNYSNKLAYNKTTTAWNEYSGTYSPVSDEIGIRSLNYANNFYFTTNIGVKKLQSISSAVEETGIKKAIGADASLRFKDAFGVSWSRTSAVITVTSAAHGLVTGDAITVTTTSDGTAVPLGVYTITYDDATTFHFTGVAGGGASGTLSYTAFGSGFMEGDSQVAYRTLWGIKDTHGTVLYGSPSGRIEIANTDGATVSDVAWTESTLTVTVTSAGHGMSTADTINVTVVSGTAFATGVYAVTWVSSSQFTFTVAAATSASGTMSYKRVSGITRDVSMRVYIPSGITTANFFQVYRSLMSANSSTIGDDEMYLVYEANPVAGDISNGYVDYVDNVPESLMGATLYTSPSQEGIMQSNDQPPLCQDMALFKNRVFMSNTKTKHIMYLTLISCGGTSGVQNGDTITISGTVYTADTTAENIATGHFYLSSTSAPAVDIDVTARSLCRVINAYTSNTTTYSYYISGYNDLPGKIAIERRDLTDSTFYAVASAHGSAWSPVLPVSGTTVYSQNDVKPNRVYISKSFLPEAVPALNFLDVGSDLDAIIRIIALRDSMYIFKDNGEIYRLSGEDINSFVVALYDNTSKLWGPRTAVVFNNQVFCFSSQGVVAVSDSGVVVKSFDIEDQLKQYLSTELFPTFKTVAWAVAYESDRKYILSDTNTMYVYMSLTDSWTIWTPNGFSGVVNPADNKLYIGNNDQYVYQERKALDKYDYADDSITVNITGSSSYTVNLASTAGITVGDTLYQSAKYAVITAIGSGNVTVDKLYTWTVAAATVYTPIECELEWLPIYGDNPGIMKRFTELTVLFQAMNEKFTIYFNNNFYAGVETSQDISPSSIGSGWGTLPWGTGVWGGGDSVSQEQRCYFPTDYQRALWQKVRIKTKRSFTNFSLTGIGVTLYPTSTRFEKS